MARAYVCMKISEYPPPTPRAFTMTQKGKYTSKEMVVLCFRLQFQVNGKLIKIETARNLVPSDYFENFYTSACGAKYAYRNCQQAPTTDIQLEKNSNLDTDQTTVDNKRLAKS